MTVADLIALLNNMPADANVFHSNVDPDFGPDWYIPAVALDGINVVISGADR